MGEGEDESEIPLFGGGSLIWHWGATRDNLGMPGLSDWSRDSGQEPAGRHPPPSRHLPLHSRGAESWGAKPTLGAHIGLEGASRDTSSLTPEMRATASLPACPGSCAKGETRPFGQDAVLTDPGVS